MKYYKKIIHAVTLSLLFTTVAVAQTVSNLIKEVSTTSLDQMLNEFSGEVTTTVKGNEVTILNRVSASGNDLSADYLEEKLKSFGSLDVVSDQYSGGTLGGRNIIATQLGKKNPNDIYIISAHYDAVANYCADDNATGTVAVLEVARVLSKYSTDNTIIYALWDEEEQHIVGSLNWVRRAINEKKNILGAINVDMIGYDKDGNNNIPIHTNTHSLSLKDDALNVLKTHSVAIGLTPEIVNPGISSSDHASFWNDGIKAIMLSEAVVRSDLTPYYHTAKDKVSTLHLPYFHKISKYLMAIAAEKAWATKSPTPTLDIEKEELQDISVYPNPTTSYLNIERQDLLSPMSLQLVNMMGQIIHQEIITSKETTISTEDLPNGVFFLKMESDTKSMMTRILKQ